MRRYTVGISIFVNANGDLGLYENGLRQNAIFLYNLFSASDKVDKVYLLNHGDGEPRAGAGVGLPVDVQSIVRTPDVEHELDFVIQIGAAIDVASCERMRRRGIKIVAYVGGNGAVISMEASICQPPRADALRFFDVGCYDAIWMTSQHIHTYRGFEQTLYRLPVVEIPQIWQPSFLLARLPDPMHSSARYTFRPGDQRVAILDPNITVMKTSHVPMLVCEAAYQKSPKSMQQVLVTNAIHLNADETFKSFCHSLSLVRDGRLNLEGRFATAEFLSLYGNYVVTHHWENGLNYLYYDVLAGGFPLIHNAESLQDFGYYYPSWDAIAGGNCLLDALAHHGERLGAYRERANALLRQVDALNPENIRLHEQLLFEL